MSNTLLINDYLSFLHENNLYYLYEQDGTKDLKDASKVKQLIQNYKINLQNAKSMLKKYNINTKQIEKDGNQISRKILSMVKQKRPLKEINNYMKKSFPKVMYSLKDELAEDKYGDLTNERVKNSVLYTVLIILVGTILTLFLIPIFGLQATNIISAVILAPILEEFFKSIAVIHNYPYIYTTVFASTEFILYLIQYLSLGAPLPKIILARFPAFVLHFVTVYIQKYIHDKKIEQKINDMNPINFGYFVGVAIHAVFNILALGVVIRY